MMGIEPMTSSLPRKRSTPELHRRKVFNFFPFAERKIIPDFTGFRAGDRVRTGDIQLGRLTLYQLSYSRILILNSESWFSIFQAYIFAAAKTSVGRAGFEPAKT